MTNTLNEMIQMDLVKYLDEYDKLEENFSEWNGQQYMVRLRFLVQRIQELKELITK